MVAIAVSVIQAVFVMLKCRSVLSIDPVLFGFISAAISTIGIILFFFLNMIARVYVKFTPTKFYLFKFTVRGWVVCDLDFSDNKWWICCFMIGVVLTLFGGGLSFAQVCVGPLLSVFSSFFIFSAGILHSIALKADKFIGGRVRKQK